MIFLKALKIFVFLAPALVNGQTNKTEPSATNDAIAEIRKPSLLPSIPQIPNNVSFTITNNCSFGIHPASLTMNGTGPYTSGYYLDPGETRKVHVSNDWIGRFWGRTNCTFELFNTTSQKNVSSVRDYNATLPNDIKVVGGCLTGDCGSAIQCQLSGLAPATLAEFNMRGYMNLTYFDISLVDGYSLDMSITPHHDSDKHPRRLNAPKCVASTWTSDYGQGDLYKNSLNESYSFKHIQRFCPRQMLRFQLPHLAFPYPDDGDEEERGGWTPCLSACAYSGSSWDCCTGKHDKPETCGPNLYSKRVKQVCGDAYSYAYDDYYSTFGVPSGEGFDIMFCPSGESTNILKSTLPPPSLGAQHLPSRLVLASFVVFSSFVGLFAI